MNPTMHLVETLDDVRDYLDWLKNPRPYLALDTETTGLKWWTPDFVRTVQVGDKDHGWTIPLKWWYRVVKDSLESYPGQFVFHNATFDLHALEISGISLPQERIDDTYALAWLVNPISRHDLKGLSTQLLDKSAAVGQSALKNAMKQNGWGWDSIPIDFLPYWAYGALDTCLTAGLVEVLQPEIDRLGLRKSYELEMAVSHIFRKAETRGARLDLEYTQNLKTQWDRKIATLEMELSNFGIDNPNAARQIAAALAVEDDWEPEDFTATGKPKLDEKILRGIDSQVARKVIEYKRLRKWTSTYLDTFLMDNDNGVLHASINTLRARTGRMSITNPALQTLPRGPEIRNCIIPSEGHVLYAVDYSQVELRMLAHYANEESMIAAFKAGEDLHSDTARRIFGPDFTEQQRSISKNANFATVYGAGPAKFAYTCNKDAEVITEEEAKSILDRYRTTYPGVTRFMRQIEEIARGRLNTEGTPYVVTTGGRRLPSNHDKTYSLVNFLCQGTAAEVFKEAVVRLDNAGLSEYIVLPVHDELIFDFPADEADVLAKTAQELMRDDSFRVPLTVEGSGPYTRWGDKYVKKIEQQEAA